MSEWFDFEYLGGYQECLQKDNLKTQVFGVIKYPIYEIIGTIKKYVDDDISSLDYHIMKLANQLENPEKSSLSLVLGLTDGIIRWRLADLEIQQYLAIKGQKIKLTKKGKEFIQTPNEKIVIEITHKFFVDGISLKPMSKEYYGSKNRHTIIEQMDYDFEPDLIHTPPSDLIIEHINKIPQKEREEYAIPKSFIELVDYDFRKIIHPLGIQFATDSNGKMIKKLVDCCNYKLSSEYLNEENDNLKDIVAKIQVTCAHPTSNNENTMFKTNLDKIYEKGSDHIFNMSKDNIISAIMDARYFKVEIIDPDDISFSDDSITFNIDKKYFEIGRPRKKEIIRNLRKGISWIYQQRMGIYLIYIHFIPIDEYVQNIVEIIEDYEKEDNSPQFLINKYGQEKLRRLLLGIEYYDELERLDINLHFSNHLANSHNGNK